MTKKVPEDKKSQSALASAELKLVVDDESGPERDVLSSENDGNNESAKAHSDFSLQKAKSDRNDLPFITERLGISKRTFIVASVVVIMSAAPLFIHFFGAESLTVIGFLAITAIIFILSWTARTSAINPVRNPSPDSNKVEGTWVGEYAYNNVPDNAHVIDREFTAFISYNEGAINGRIKDSAGEATIKGMCNYPDVRFQKMYESGNSLFYEGAFSSDGSIAGAWGTNGYDVAGSWIMKRVHEQ